MRRIIVCCDGTNNAPEMMNPDKYFPTNVIKLARGIKQIAKKGDVDQIVLYLRGVGTEGGVRGLIARATGYDVELNVYQAYQFITDNYQRDDHVFLFGFSRGAYSVRLLAGFIDAVKVIPKHRMHEFADIYECYKSRNNKYGEDFSGLSQRSPGPDGEVMTIPIWFLGVWDTVTTTGLPDEEDEKKIGHPLIDAVPSNVHYAYQALALHELRKLFKPRVWTARRNEGSIVEQTWFPGAHSDVGGGYKEHELSNIALEWMVDRASEGGGLEFKDDFFKKIGPIPPPSLPRFFSQVTESIRKGWVYEKQVRRKCQGIFQFKHRSVDARLACTWTYEDHQKEFKEVDERTDLKLMEDGKDCVSVTTELKDYLHYLGQERTKERMENLAKKRGKPILLKRHGK